jgi:DNA processing protein
VVLSADDIMQQINFNNMAMLESGNLFSSARISAAKDDELTGARPQVIEKIGHSPTAIDDIIAQTGIAVNVVLTILLELELAGRLERYAGNKVALIYVNEELFA